MVGMAANKLMGLIRDKGNVNGLGKPKERGSKPNGPTWQEWQPTGLQAWQEKEKHKQKSDGLDGQELLPKQYPAHGRIKGGRVSPKAHTTYLYPANTGEVGLG